MEIRLKPTEGFSTDQALYTVSTRVVLETILEKVCDCRKVVSLVAEIKQCRSAITPDSIRISV